MIRVLLLSLELDREPFSGNGVLATSVLNGLRRRADADVRAICCSPDGDSDSHRPEDCRDASDDDVWAVRLPAHCTWKRLDREGPWEEFRDLAPSLVGDVVRYRPTHAVAVDWHGMLAWRAILEGAGPGSGLGGCKAVYYNFRVYSASAFGVDDDGFYAEKERLACRHADRVVCLSGKDRDSLVGLMEGDGGHDAELSREKSGGISVLYPPLRGDICELARREAQSVEATGEGGSVSGQLPEAARQAIERLADATDSKNVGDIDRCFITCAVRMSPEKAPHNFVRLLRSLGGADFLRRNNLIPVLCGARSVEDYAEGVVRDFESLFSDDDWPRIVIDHHLGPEELAAVFSRSVLNVHPCPYDAYGMTAVESASAAFRCPTVLDRARGRRGRGPASRRPRPGSADRRGTAGGTVRRRHRSRTRGAIARPGVRAFAGPTPGRRNAVSRSAGAAARRVPTWRT